MRWRQELGPFDTAAVYQRLQAHRQGFMLLLIRQGKPVAFVKLKEGDGSALRAEASTLSAVSKFAPGSFRVPEPLVQGQLSDWHYFAAAPLPSRPHRVPENPPLTLIVREIEAALADLPRPRETPDHWRPMHGDLTPWNLRQLINGGLILMDWEDAGWGPPRADEVLYRATAMAVRGEPATSSDAQEAIDYWQARIHDWPAGDKRDRKLALALADALERMGTPAKAAALTTSLMPDQKHETHPRLRGNRGS